MNKIAFIVFWTVALFMGEFVCFHLFGRVFLPNLLLLFIIFVDLFFGIRWGIAAAVFAGIIHDSVSISFFGIYLFSYLVCAYLTVLLKKYVYTVGSCASRLLLVALMVVICFLVQYVIRLMFQQVPFTEALRYVLLPQLVTTLLVATVLFEYLKKCAFKFYVS